VPWHGKSLVEPFLDLFIQNDNKDAKAKVPIQACGERLLTLKKEDIEKIYKIHKYRKTREQVERMWRAIVERQVFAHMQHKFKYRKAVENWTQDHVIAWTEMPNTILTEGNIKKLQVKLDKPIDYNMLIRLNRYNLKSANIKKKDATLYQIEELTKSLEAQLKQEEEKIPEDKLAYIGNKKKRRYLKIPLHSPSHEKKKKATPRGTPKNNSTRKEQGQNAARQSDVPVQGSSIGPSGLSLCKRHDEKG